MANSIQNLTDVIQTLREVVADLVKDIEALITRQQNGENVDAQIAALKETVDRLKEVDVSVENALAAGSEAPPEPPVEGEPAAPTEGETPSA